MVLPAIVTILIALNVTVLQSFADQGQTLQDTRAQVIEVKQQSSEKSKKLDAVAEQKAQVESSLRDIRLENESLKANLQAKKEAEQAILASVQKAPVQETVAQNKPAPAVQVTGDKHSWLAASGIPEAHWGYVDAIVTRESGWNPNAVNASSGACGLGQQLPCGKWAGAWNDPVAALRAMNGYVNGRYGGWPQANAFWNANHWY